MKNNPDKSPKEILYERYSDLFDFAEAAVEKNPSLFKGQNYDSLSRGITLFHSVRSIYLLSAIRLLCIEGYATESMVLLRSLLNLYINIKWMTSEDSEVRMKRFADFEIVFKKLSYDATKECGYSLNEGDEIKVAELNDEFEKIKKKYNLKGFRDYRNWSGKTIYQMSKEVGLKTNYKIVYGRLSEIEHSSPNSTGEYLDWGENEEFVMHSGPRDTGIPLVLVSSLTYFYGVKELVHSIFKLDCESFEIEKGKLRDLVNKY